MPITRVGASQASALGGVTSRVLTVTPTAVGNLLVVGFLVSNSAASPSVSVTTGTAHTFVVANTLNQDATNAGSLLSWYTIATVTSALTITVQSNVAAQFCSMSLEEFTGTHLTDPFDAMVNSADGASGTPISPTITPVAADCLVWASAYDNITAVGNIGGSAATKGADDLNADWTEFRVLTGGAGVGITAAFTGSGAFNVMAATFKPASAGGALFTPRSQSRPFPYAPGSARARMWWPVMALTAPGDLWMSVDVFMSLFL